MIRARLLALKINTGRFLQLFLPFLVVLAVIASCIVLILRKNGALSPAIWGLCGVSMLLGALTCFFLAGRRGWTSLEGALVLLEDRLGLHNRLSSANQGIGLWPAPPKQGAFIRWQPLQVIGLPLCAVMLVLVSGFIPVSKRHTDRANATQEPLAWSQLDEILQTLEEEKLVEEKEIGESIARLNELRGQDPGDWYAHESLEAGDSLLRETSAELESLRQDLQLAETALHLLAQRDAPGSDNPADMELLSDALKEALKGLEMGNFPLSRELLDQLKLAEVMGAGQLSPAELQQLLENLQKASAVCGKCNGNGTNTCGKAAALLGSVSSAGKGGVTRGPGHVPLDLSHNSAGVEAGKSAALSSPDLSRAALGERIGESSSRPETDPSAFPGASSQGGEGVQGRGGEAVWRASLVPEEKNTLRAFFK